MSNEIKRWLLTKIQYMVFVATLVVDIFGQVSASKVMNTAF